MNTLIVNLLATWTREIKFTEKVNVEKNKVVKIWKSNIGVHQMDTQKLN